MPKSPGEHAKGGGDHAPQRVGDGAAARRAQAIVDTLATAGISPTRLQSGSIAQVKAGSGPVTAELALEVMPGAS